MAPQIKLVGMIVKLPHCSICMKHFLQPRTRRVVEPHQQSAGFTLVELLVAVAITGIVITAAGFGLVAILQANKKAEAATNRRIELNRALDFMAEEVKMASNIEENVAIDVQASLASDFPSDCDVPSDGVDCALILQIPNVDQRIIYYVWRPADNSPWLGPKVIYRWGPNIDLNGNYTNPNNPSRWTVEPLVDLIEDSVPAPNPNCPSGWTANPPVPDRDGFYSCVNSSGKVAEIYLRGKLTDSLTTNPSCGSDEKVPYYCIKTRVFARSSP